VFRVRAAQAALLAVPVGVVGFALAGSLLAASVEPTAWNPVVDPAAGASVTDVGDPDAVSPVTGRVIFYVFPTQQPYTVERAPEPAPTVPLPPRIEGELGIPQIVLDAYRAAETTLAGVDPSCHLTWQMLAGVGRVESDHAHDGLVFADGTTFTPILGPVLDGSGGYPAIHDTDDGLLDGDPVWDRAVGPMQFIPGTWASVGVDGNGDGKADPHNVFDAALSAGRYLCGGSTDLADRSGLVQALLRYNHSPAYVTLVLAWIDGYTAGQVVPLPPKPTPPPTTAPPTTIPTTPPPTTPPTTTPTTTTPVSTTPGIGPTGTPTPTSPPPTTGAETTTPRPTRG
jgi:hypothetical protein